RGGVERARSKRPWAVVPPAPIVSALTPNAGPPGAIVRISGRNFGGADRIRFGRSPVAVVGRGADWVDVRVPGKARADGPFYVAGAGGEASSPVFRIELPAVISGVRPSWGAPGSQFS